METLHEVKTLNVARGLKGMAVVDATSGEKLGEAICALIHPTAGRLVAITLLTPQREVRTLAAADLTIEGETIRAAADSLAQDRETALRAEGTFASQDIVGALVITERGALLGRVSEVHVAIETRRVYYRVVKSEWQRLMSGGFFLAGDVPRSYFHRNRRLIVPADAQGKEAEKPLAETA
jgi:sporulation protein YlmC with PRC-barrel domain